MMDNERGANSLDNETQLLIPIWAYEMIQKKKRIYKEYEQPVGNIMCHSSSCPSPPNDPKNKNVNFRKELYV